jgi:uncharacterized protein with beta-barrel porin domain
VGTFTIDSHVGLAYAAITRDPFAESGGDALDLSVTESALSELRSETGFEAATGAGATRGSLRGAYLYDINPAADVRHAVCRHRASELHDDWRHDAGS